MSSRKRQMRKGTWCGADLETVALVIGGVLLAIGLRLSLLPFESGDFTQFTRKWFEAIGTLGAREFLATGVTNYAPAYTYLMLVAHALWGSLPTVAAIKLITLPFDAVCAWYIARIVGLRWESAAVRGLAFVATLFLPTVVINGAMWGQADAIYTAGLAAFVYYAAVRRDVAAFVALGLAFSVKLQAVFVAPLVLLLLLSRHLSWRAMLWTPALYGVALVPAWIAGRPLGELLAVYWKQTGFYPRLTSNAPHLYQWLPGDAYEILLPAGLLWAAAVVGIVVFVVHRARIAWTPGRIVEVATITLILVPFCTPKMHERYFFPADVLALALAFHRPQLFYVPLVVGLISFFSYAPFLMKKTIVPLPLLAIGMATVLTVLLYQFARSIAAERRQEDRACA